MKKLLNTNLMKIVAGLILASLIAFDATAQEFKIKLSKGDKLKLENIRGSIYVEQHSGNELIVQAPSASTPTKAKGLTLMGSKIDNTGASLNQKKEGKVLTLTGIRRKKIKYYIKVPKGVSLKAHLRGLHTEYLEVKNFDDEIEVNVNYAKVTLDGVSGPVLLNATYKGAKVVFNKINQDKPSSIVSPYGDVDVTLPANTKANITAKSSYGEIYTNMDIKLSGDPKRRTSSTVKGTLNGGGVEIEVRSPYKNVYIRKK